MNSLVQKVETLTLLQVPIFTIQKNALAFETRVV